MKRISFIFLLLIISFQPLRAAEQGFAFIDELINQYPGQSGVLVLDRGSDALIARAWLADHARTSIEVQYFIWSTDNVGILATEALLRAADRGVKVRVIVDDLLIDAPDDSLLALALHENIEIKIYNPKHSVGTSVLKRIYNVMTDFRGVNQRMHDKTFIVDGKVVITGGRNMADEYFDYDQAYNFRDRDVLLLGNVAGKVRESFERFWASELTAKVEERFSGRELLQPRVEVSEQQVQSIYKELHQYAQNPQNFAYEVREAIQGIAQVFPVLARHIVWGQVHFISDQPGKNEQTRSLGGAGESSIALAELMGTAKTSVVIQSPYLVLSDEALAVFDAALARGVKIKICTNSLASTDNLQAYSGYRNQREELLDRGIEVYEYKPFPEVQRKLLERLPEYKDKRPVFAIHAKSMVIDSSQVFIGTYNLDPRSENLNTEVGVIINNSTLAKQVEQSILEDMQEGNSWPASDEPDQYAPPKKRLKVMFWQLMPIQPLL